MDNRKEITYEEYVALLGNVPEGKRLILMSTGRCFIADNIEGPNLFLKKEKNVKKSKTFKKQYTRKAESKE